MDIFAISKDDVIALNDLQARELIARLAKAELNSQKIPTSAVLWGGDQRAADDGIDVAIASSVDFPAPNFVPTNATLFQVKAENFGPAKIKVEMCPKGTLRKSIADLGSAGSYLIASTRDNCSPPMLKKRRDMMANCLANLKNNEKPRTDFYDAQRIADWANLHPSVVVWLRQTQGNKINGWRPYEAWAHQETDVTSNYILDEKARIIAPGESEGITAETAIIRLRGELKSPVSIRLVGLSGVGKTRLLQAVFDSRIAESEPELHANNVLYCDISHSPAPTPLQIVEDLQTVGSDAVVVVDNCSSPTHNRLTELIQREGNKLKLITVEYDIRDDLPEKTLCYRMEGSSEEVLRKILEQSFPKLHHGNILKIAEFSDGNARIAFALADNVEAGEELQRLRNDELFDRLFRQQNDPDNLLLECAKAGSLVYSFDASNLTPTGELASLAAQVETSPLEFSKQVRQLFKRGLVQSRGHWRAVLPHAIANRLAANALEDLPAKHWVEHFFEGLNDRMRKSFIRRIGYLHDVPVAVEVASILMNENKLSALTTHDEYRRSLFLMLAPVVPELALTAIEQVVNDADFMALSDRERSPYIEMVGSIAYDCELFGRSIAVFKQMMNNVTDEKEAKASRDLITGFFSLYFSRTKATPEQRIQCVRAMLNSQEEIGIACLGAALQSGNFIGFHGTDFGAKKNDWGWKPDTYADITEWYLSWLEVTLEFGNRTGASGKSVRKLFASHLRGLWGIAQIRGKMSEIASLFHNDHEWYEGWLEIKQTIYFDASKDNDASWNDIYTLEEKMRPVSLRDQVVARIMGHNSTSLHELEEFESIDADDAEARKLRWDNVAARTKDLGILASQERDLIEDLIPLLCRRSSSSGILDFGEGVGQGHPKPIIFLKKVREFLEKSIDAPYSLIWLRGFFKSWNVREPVQVQSFFDAALADAVWARYFVELQMMIEFDDRAFERLMRLMDTDKCPSRQFGYLAFGGMTKSLSSGQVGEFISKLRDRDEDGRLESLEVLYMAIYNLKERTIEEVAELRSMSMRYLEELNWDSLNGLVESQERRVETVLDFALEGDCDESLVRNLIRQVKPEPDTRRRDYKSRNILQPFFKWYPKLALQEVLVPDEKGSYGYLSRLLIDRFRDDRIDILAKIPSTDLIEWCEDAPDLRFPFVIENYPLFSQKKDSEKELQMNTQLEDFLGAVPDKELAVKILSSRMEPSSWSGSRAAVIERRLVVLERLKSRFDENIGLLIEEELARLRQYVIDCREEENARDNRESDRFE